MYAELIGNYKKLEIKSFSDNKLINGALIEGRIFYDSFVMEAKKLAVYAWKEV